MIDYLKNVDISDKTIKKMYEIHDESTLLNLETNEENCLGIIIFMRKIGINNIDELLLYKPDWFLKTTKSFINCFSNNKEKLVSRINNNYLDVTL